MPRTGTLFSDPQIEQVRHELADRLSHWQAPDGADPAAVADMKSDLQNLLDHYHSYPGQSVDDAVASLRYSFEDRVHDFAQDQKIDALLDDHQNDLNAAQAVDTQVDTLRTQLEDRLNTWQAPDGADADAVTDMKSDLQGMLQRFHAVPGQSADDALADLRALQRSGARLRAGPEARRRRDAARGARPGSDHDDWHADGPDRNDVDARGSTATTTPPTDADHDDGADGHDNAGADRLDDAG